MPKRPIAEPPIEIASKPKPAAKRAPRRAARPKSTDTVPPSITALGDATIAARPVPPVKAGLSRRGMLFAGLGVFTGGAAIGLGVGKWATPDGLAVASRRIAASAPVWFVEEEPLPNDIHAPLPRAEGPLTQAPAAQAQIAQTKPVEPSKPPEAPKLAEPKPSDLKPIEARPAAPVTAPVVAQAPRPAPRPSAAMFPSDGRPTIAIVIDDVGIDRARSERVLALPAEVTIAFMTYAEQPRQWGERARVAGHEYLVHVPMQPSGSVDPGPNALLMGLEAEELRRRLRWGLDRWEGHVGANNHMGSRFTESASGMSLVMEELRARGLLFLDSRTSPKSVAGTAAHQAAIPFAERNIFLDNEATPAGLQRQLAALDDLARKRGHAIAIGHPHDATLAALAAWVPTAQSRGLRVVPLTKVMHHA
jgi:polysaccharide deacetylase 2 family uncharacterized protein YibQ